MINIFKKKRTLMELLSDKSRKSISGEELQAAKDYEKSLLPKNLTVPKAFEIYHATKPTSVRIMLSFKAAFTDALEAELQPGTEIKLSQINEEVPLSVSATLVDYKNLETELVPEHIRKQSNYGGYGLSISILSFQDGSFAKSK